jgi:hypothetical protein
MKILQLDSEGVWNELRFTEVPEERLVLANEADSVIAQAKYEEIKPSVEDYVFMSMDLNLESMSGILNYREKDEHKQLRW